MWPTPWAPSTTQLLVADQPASRAQKTRLAQLKGDLRRFVARATNLGYAVHAVAGGLDWTDAAHRSLGSKLVQLIADYNGTVLANERRDLDVVDEPPLRSARSSSISMPLR
jgi:6-phosphogluconate dehydrogenase